MSRDIRLLFLFYVLLLPALCACGRITHDIGQIRADNSESDASIDGPNLDAQDTEHRRDAGTSSAGKEELQSRDANSDLSHLDVGVAKDAEVTHVAGDGEIDSADESDALSNECVEERFEVEFVPFELDIYVMMDAVLFSGFWSPVLTPEQMLLWTEVQQEISTFVDDPDSEGIGVGIQYYGQLAFDGDPFIATSCEVSTYRRPAVSVAELPDNAQKIKDSFPTIPFASSPSVPALEGAIMYARSRVQAYPGRKQVVFLITGPSVFFDPACGSTFRNLSNVARQGYNSDPYISSYTIGIYTSDIDYPAMTTYLREVAIQGGTSGPYLASLSRQNPELALRLEEAREDAKLTACGFLLSQDYQDGLPEAIDPNLASIVVTTDDNEEIELKAVRDHSDCPGEAGWHFDDPANPSSLIACEKTCEDLDSESISNVELRLNCTN